MKPVLFFLFFASSFMCSRAQTYRVNCNCVAKELPKLDMGTNYYPRYLSDYQCDDESCPPTMACNEIRYKTWVLKKKEFGDEDDQRAPLLPEEIRNTYIYKVKYLTAGCECLQICPH